MKESLLTVICCAAVALSCSASVGLRGRLPRHVIFIGSDGFSAKCVRDGVPMPCLRTLMEDGAWTLKSRSILPSSSACNWRSIFTCSASEQHGYNSVGNREPVFEPAAIAENGLYPDVFWECRRQRPSSKIAFLYEWGGLAYCASTSSCDIVVQAAGSALVEAAIGIFRKEHPDFMSVVFNDPDNDGHNFGWESIQYKSKIRRIDSHVARIVEAVRHDGLWNETVIVFTSDHGGLGKKHGGATLAEIERPLIFAGGVVVRGHEIRRPTAVYDVGASLAVLLGLRLHEAWIGRPIAEAFAL